MLAKGTAEAGADLSVAGGGGGVYRPPLNARWPTGLRAFRRAARYPAIAVTATLLRARSFTLDGEAVVCGPDGVAIFDALHRRGTVTEAMLYAFDVLELGR
jgi:hypothetical protein